MPYRLSRKAEEDIIAIFLEGARQFGWGQAELYHSGLEKSFAFLADFPLAARERKETVPPVRVHPYQSHIVVYRIEADGILILRVRHGREDWAPREG